MGRYAQRRLRGGTSLPPAPPSGLTILSITAAMNPGEYDITWDATATFDTTFVGSDSALTISGQPVTALSGGALSPGTVTRVVIGSVFGPGTAWAVSGQPAWLTDTIIAPQGGVTT